MHPSASLNCWSSLMVSNSEVTPEGAEHAHRYMFCNYPINALTGQVELLSSIARAHRERGVPTW